MKIQSIIHLNLEEAIKELEDAFITSHHLSCQASRTTHHNSAISIYFQKPKDSYIAMGIPGINYVFQKKRKYDKL